MATLRDIQKRITAVSNTRQITKAMEMVAAAKLRRAQLRVEQSRPYSEKMRLILEQISVASTSIKHPFFEKREVKNKILVLFTSDRGLCGSYNSNLMRKAMQYLEENEQYNPKLILVGKKGEDHFKRQKWEIIKVFKDMGGNLDFDVVRDLNNLLIEKFTEGEADHIELLYYQFLSMTRFKIGVFDFLPIDPPEVEEKVNKDYIFEPNPEKIFATLMPSYALTVTQMALADALASEHGTRMIAMGQATKNAGEMVDDLTLVYNKARQAQITKELLEIVSGAEALE